MIDNHTQNVSSIWSFRQKKLDQLPNIADVVIIGGGIIGVSTAYFLAKSGVNVCLCEKGYISGEQSGRNWGWVRVQGRDEREIPLMLRSLEIWRGLSDEIQGDTGYKECGCLYSAYNHKEMDSYDSWLKLAKKYDIKTEVLNKADLEREAGQVAKRWIGGIITKTDGRAEPHQATISIAKAAQNLGAKILTKTAVKHKKFSDITDYFQKNDLLILNDTKVFPAKLFATKDRTDAKVEIFLLRELGDRLWEVLVKPARKVRIGNKLILSDGLFCDVIDNTVSGGRVVRFEFDKGNFDNILDKLGHPPLPPYIERPATDRDKERYQTVYAEKRGAVAAPIAGLHFTKEILAKLKKKGVNIYYITLHIGLGTFKPVQVEDLNRHHMDSEYFEVSPGTAVAINEAKRKRRRIFAVGTSTVRALETVNVSGFQISPKKGWTNKFIHPPQEFKIVDGLITNFHQPESTLLMLTSAFGGYKFIKDSYKVAKSKNYRFLSYGDSMLIM